MGLLKQYSVQKLELKELLGEKVRHARLEAAEAEMLVVDSLKPEVTYVTSVLPTPYKLIGEFEYYRVISPLVRS